MYIQGAKDLLTFVKLMKDIVTKYHKGHSATLDSQFEDVRSIPKKNIEEEKKSSSEGDSQTGHDHSEMQ